MYKRYRHYCDRVGRDSSVGIVTGYGLDGPRIESALVQTSPGAHPTSYTMDTGSLLGGTAGRGVALTFWAFRAGYRVTFTFTYYDMFRYKYDILRQ